MRRLIITLAVILIASICWSKVLSANMTDIAKLKPLMGTWEFTWYVDSPPITRTYTLNNIYKRDGKYYIGGPEVTARYDDVEGKYYMSDFAAMSFYCVFNFTEANAVAGTFYPRIPGGIIDISFPFTGIKVAEVSPDPCPASAIYGNSSKQTELLRSIRDNVLSQTHEGRELIELYYKWSPVIVRAMEHDEEFKEDVKDLVDGFLGMVEVE